MVRGPLEEMEPQDQAEADHQAEIEAPTDQEMAIVEGAPLIDHVTGSLVALPLEAHLMIMIHQMIMIHLMTTVMGMPKDVETPVDPLPPPGLDQMPRWARC